MRVDTGQVRAAAYGIRPLGEGLTNVRVDALVRDLAEALAGGAFDGESGEVASDWGQRIASVAADVEATAHDYESSASLYDSVEAQLTRLAARAARFLGIAS